MNKAEFLSCLEKALGRLPRHEIEQSLAFYSEMIDDRIEDGMTEEEAIESLGNVEDIATQIINETPIFPKAVAKANTGSRTLNIVLLIVFSPIWVPIALAIAITLFSIWVSLWAIILSLWAVVLSLVVGGLVALIGTFVTLLAGHPLTALIAAGSGLFCIGLGLFAFFGVLFASKGLFNLSVLFTRKVKSFFVKERSEK